MWEYWIIDVWRELELGHRCNVWIWLEWMHVRLRLPRTLWLMLLVKLLWWEWWWLPEWAGTIHILRKCARGWLHGWWRKWHLVPLWALISHWLVKVVVVVTVMAAVVSLVGPEAHAEAERIV
jgi:hypothetical protein